MAGSSSFQSVGVVGAGAWGTALAQLCASNGVATRLWAREDEVVEAINASHVNAYFLSGVALSPNILATRELAVIAKCEAVLFVAPAQFARAILTDLSTFDIEKKPFALCSKGIETATGAFMTDVLREVVPQIIPAVLSGPSFASDVARGLPTAVTLACEDPALGRTWAATIAAPHFRPYLSTDLIGAELGGAVKNVLAIAAGIVVGRELGESARASVIARGFAEFQRLGHALGAKTETMSGLSGLGDLVLTASSPQSRNMSLGVELGKGRELNAILSERHTVAEGVATASALRQLAAEHGIEMPISAGIAEVVTGKKSVDRLISELLNRPIKSEA